MKILSPESRARCRSALAGAILDVLVIGGGITGSGIARDASMRGLHAGLVDRYDFAFGTSSRSSRLLHGGLRYLEQARVGLVREASNEKKILREIAPHLAEPLAFVFPAYKNHRRPLWQLRLGVKLYDFLCGGGNFEPSRAFTRDETMRLLPGLKHEGLLGSVRYFDALTNDARLVLDTLRSATAHGAHVSNYSCFRKAARTAGVWSCEVEDMLTRETFTVRSRTLVNATGPWARDLPHSGVKLRLSKGVHLVFDRARLPVTDAVVIAEGKRILFLIPWGERVITGTTDTDYLAAPEEVRVDPADTAYILRAVNESFPDVALREHDIVSCWAGLRPLIANPNGGPSDISRAHRITSPEPGWWDVAGGKLTTYRLMAEQAVDLILRHLGRSAPACRTAVEPLLPAAWEKSYSAILPPPCTSAVVEHFVKNEWAVHLDDVMSRRSNWHFYHASPIQLTEQVGGWMSEILGWSPGTLQRELAASRRAASSRPEFPHSIERFPA